MKRRGVGVCDAIHRRARSFRCRCYRLHRVHARIEMLRDEQGYTER